MKETQELIAIEALQREAEQRSALVERQTDQAMGRGAGMPLRLLMSPQNRQQIRNALTRELSMGFDYRREAIAMALEMRLQSFREACNQVLIDGKTRLRQQRLEYFTRTYAEVEKHVDRLTEDFLNDLDKRFERISRFKTESVRVREQQRLERRMDDYLDTFEKLMANFAGILSEQIGHRLQDGTTVRRVMDSGPVISGARAVDDADDGVPLDGMATEVPSYDEVQGDEPARGDYRL